MFRNKTNTFMIRKQQLKTNEGQNNNQQFKNYDLTPQWFEDYYREKQHLKHIAERNRGIQQLVNQYQVNPTVYILKVLQQQIKTNSSVMDRTDRDIVEFETKGRLLLTPTQIQIKRNISKYLKTQLVKQIKLLFQSKQKVQAITSNIDAYHSHQNSLSFARNDSMSINQNNKSALNASYYSNDRQQVLNEVNYTIQSLNSILRRINIVVQQQGQLINRIDENLQISNQNVKKGVEQLQYRRNKQQGYNNQLQTDENEGFFDQFRCYGRINKVIMALYVLNIILMIVLIVKNILK